ncbi:hypothetical protein GWI33_002234 [Rhynchophorus ferrugineus]|uniref:Uncharacterized protein n=1 Tax=Rhynchophorus ferrugineus TaxID=354439 RepID=A0A834IN45_RHYFE|nr:hypothetical protein GWI33_002234 [Rhynchophorus ferrugineus]
MIENIPYTVNQKQNNNDDLPNLASINVDVKLLQIRIVLEQNSDLITSEHVGSINAIDSHLCSKNGHSETVKSLLNKYLHGNPKI